MKKASVLILTLVILLFLRLMAQPANGAQQIAGAISSSEKKLVLLHNKDEQIPLKDLQNLSIASIHFSYQYSQHFDSIASKYWNIKSIDGSMVKDKYGYSGLLNQVRFNNQIILKISDSTLINDSLLAFSEAIGAYAKVIIVAQGNVSKLLSQLDQLKYPVIISPENDAVSASLAAQAIFGGIAVNGRLNKNYSRKYKKGDGDATQKIRLGYSVPESVGISAKDLAAIDSIAEAGIKEHFAPAAVVLVAQKGQVIYNKAFGTHTYGGHEITQLNDIFDMASVTKVTATTPAIMYLYNEGLIKLTDPISRYIPELKKFEDKKDITVKEALLHEAGFVPYIPFYANLKPLDMSPVKSDSFPTKVADHAYLKASYFEDVMWPQIINAPVKTRGQFVYSDLSMYMMKEVFESYSHQPVDAFLLKELYQPLGMQRTGYLPRERFDKSQIIPTTENDTWFRNMQVLGYVNDPGAAMAGGVQGHAGLFATANDLAIFYQMMLNKGTYGGRRFFKESTVDLFTSDQSTITNRGLGFFKTYTEDPVHAQMVSSKAFGHGGYTGTFVWVDPQYELVYICLTNRVYPDVGVTYGNSPGKNIRPKILDLIYNIVSKP
ncbi:MAG: serine hydrolase [Agriterribacter sp.]